MSVSSAIDTSGVAVITGGASGIGLTVARRLVRAGMRVAILDISVQELEEAGRALRSEAGGAVLTVLCDVTQFEQCKEAQQAVARGFPDIPVSFLFNNAGILGQEIGQILEGNPKVWGPIFSVNVFGALHIIKAFLPSMLAGGPLPSGKRSMVVTTSSVVGLLNLYPTPYTVSKMTVTAMCECLAHELDSMGRAAAHISTHTLHPTACGTNFFLGRTADGNPGIDTTFKDNLVAAGVTTPEQIADGLFLGLDQGKHYIVVDHPTDIPTHRQIAWRMEDQMSGRRPRQPEPLGVLLALENPAAFKARQARLRVRSKL